MLNVFELNLVRRKSVKNFILLILFILIPFGILNAQNIPDIRGSWGLVSVKYTIGDSVVTADTSVIYAVKLINNLHYSYLFKNKKNNVLQRAASGRFVISETTYTEGIDISTNTKYIGKVINFAYRLENNVWTIRGRFDNTDIEEVWVRITK